MDNLSDVDVAKKLFMFITGATDEEDYLAMVGSTVDQDWNNLPQWQQDDYINATYKFVDFMMKVFEEA